MTTVSRFSRQNDVGLRALNVVLWENFVLVVVLVLESKGTYYQDEARQGYSSVAVERSCHRKVLLRVTH